jgi:hypothetical protein
MKKHVFNLLCWKSIVFGMLTIICQIFWKSELYVYAEGQLYWNLDSILSVRIYIYDIWTFVIVTILPTHFKISIYIENRHCLHFPNVGHFEDFCFEELLWLGNWSSTSYAFGLFWKDWSPAQWETSHGIFHIELVAHLWKNPWSVE